VAAGSTSRPGAAQAAQVVQVVPVGEAADDPALLRVGDPGRDPDDVLLQAGEVFVAWGQDASGDEDPAQAPEAAGGSEAVQDYVCP
jgi:hypothetical protein